MIKIYPSALDGEPLETHKITKKITIAHWLASKAPAFSMKREAHPISIQVNNELINPSLWAHYKITPDDEVKITPEPKGPALVIIAVVSLVALGVAIYAMQQKSQDTKQRRSGKQLDGADIKANVPRWGDPIPEIAGSPITYPALVTPQHKWYDSKIVQDGVDFNGKIIIKEAQWQATEWSELLLCIGAGEYHVEASDVFIGGTPAIALGDAVKIKFFTPNQNLQSEPAAQWWHECQEVGFTTFGGSGLTLGVSTSIETNWGGSFSRVAPNYIKSTQAAPDGWQSGFKLKNLRIKHRVTFGQNWIASELLDNNQAQELDWVLISGNEYLINSISPEQSSGDGVIASIKASKNPEYLNFENNPVSFEIEFKNEFFSLLLDVDCSTIEDLTNLINQQLDGTPLLASDDGQILTIEQQTLADGAEINLIGGYEDVLGLEPIITQGEKPTEAQPRKYYLEGALFEEGQQIVIADLLGQKYIITSVSGDKKTISIKPDDVSVWYGLPAEATIDGNLQLDNDDYQVGWAGPFRASPKGKKIDQIEIDIFYPQGLIKYSDQGDPRFHSAGGYIEYRELNSSTWRTGLSFGNEASTPDQLGFTYTIKVPLGEYEVRVRSQDKPSKDTQINDKQQWTRLKGRVIHNKYRYPEMTLMSIRMKSGDAISGGVEDKVSVRARRILPTVENPNVKAVTHDIAPFFLHVLDSVGYGREMVDMEALQDLHEIWKERGERFDLAVAGESTLKSVLNECLQAGFSELTLKNGLITPVRDAMRFDLPSRIFSPQEYTEPLEQAVQIPQPDEIDGVDVEYVEYRTGQLVTEQFRLPDDKGHRVEKIRLNGITGRLQAWRHAARRRREFAYRRISYSGATELQAMNANYLDLVGLQDGIPQYGQSCFVLAIDGNKVTVSEEIEPTSLQLLAAIRNPDGTVRQPVPVEAEGNVLTFETLPNGIKTLQGNKDATVIYLGDYYNISYPALITEIRPKSDGKVSFKAMAFDPRVYQDDDGSPYDVKLTSKPYDLDIPAEKINATAKIHSIERRNIQVFEEFADKHNSTAIINSIVRKSVNLETEFKDEHNSTAIINSIVRKSVNLETEFKDEHNSTAILTNIERKVVNFFVDFVPEEVEATAILTSIERVKK